VLGERGMNLGVYLEVLTGGRVRLGDPVSLEDQG
jgi:MOSC domain-containing protein YiiM